jgi:hypothetical protein
MFHTNLMFAIIAMIMFVAMVFYIINSIDDKPAQKHS